MIAIPEAASRQVSDRVIRVFISSTFKDMKDERDHLVKFIFPQLRKFCESRGVVWSEVDLRWGITDEEQAEGKVLPICLQEIRRCRPYFIGLLGERYGHVPRRIPRELTQEQSWLQEHGERSVTELEIIHGVLRDATMHSHAYFYFRDPGYVASVPKEKRKDFTAEDTESSAKLRSLKQRIRQARDDEVCHLRENYRDPRELGHCVLEDLTSLVNRLFPEGEKLDPLDRDLADHEAYAQNRARVYVGRKEYFDRLDEHVAGEGPPLVVVGESGSGKSALLANWAMHYREVHPSDILLMHFIGASLYSTDWAAMLRRIMAELSRNLGVQVAVPDESHALRTAFANALHMAVARVAQTHAGGQPRKLILILDGLNQLEDRDGALDLAWLPGVIPSKVRLLLSTVSGPTFLELSRRGWSRLDVELLETSERMQLVVAYLGRYGKRLAEEQVARIALNVKCANPFFLRSLLEELRISGEHDQVGHRIEQYLASANVPELLGQILARWERDYEGDRQGIVRTAMTCLWASRHGLTEQELLGLLGQNGQPLPHAYWSPLSLAAESVLVSRSGLIGFSHDYMRAAVLRRYVPLEEDQRAAHTQLLAYFGQQPLVTRVIEELPWQMVRAEAWEKLHGFLMQVTFSDVAWDIDLGVRSLWVTLEAHSNFRFEAACAPVLKKPERVGDVTLWRLAALLDEMGHPQESLHLRAHLVERYRLSGSTTKLCGALGNQALLLKHRGSLDEALSMLKEAEHLARQLGDMANLQATLGNQASILETRGDLQAAVALLDEQERICRDLRDWRGLRSSLTVRANIQYARGEVADALCLYREAERMSREIGDQEGVASSLGNQAVVLIHSGELKDGMSALQTQERLCRELGSKRSLAGCLLNQGIILKAVGNIEGAMRLYKEAERISRELDYMAGVQSAVGNQALLLRRTGDMDGAMALHREEERICRKMGDSDALQKCLGNQAIAVYERGSTDEALSLWKQQEAICRGCGFKDGLQRSIGNQAMVLEARKEYKGALSLLEEKERICRETNNAGSLAISLCNQSLLLAKYMGRGKEALPLAEEAYRICIRCRLATIGKTVKETLDSVRASVNSGSLQA